MSVKDENLVSSYYELIFESEIIAHFTKIILMVILKIKTNFEMIYISSFEICIRDSIWLLLTIFKENEF